MTRDRKIVENQGVPEYATYSDLPSPSDFKGLAFVQSDYTLYKSNGIKYDEIRTFNHDLSIIICGQSNADGRGVNNASNEKSHPSIMMLDKGENYKMAVEPLGSQVTGWINNIPNGVSPGTPGHSFGLTMAKKLLADANIRSCLVPCAIGSTKMQHWMPESNDRDMTTLFGAMNVRTEATKTTSPSVFAWVGHESDGATITESLSTGVQGHEYPLSWYNLTKEITSRFPDSIFLYAQVATDDTAATATVNRKIAESQRKLETTYGSNAAIIGSTPTDTLIGSDPLSYVVTGADAESIITLSATDVHMVTDGNTALSFYFTGTTAGKRYRVNVTVVGTGTFKVLATTQQYSAQGAGVYAYDILATGTTITFSRNSAGVAADLTFSNISVQEMPTVSRQNHYMVVTHDLPRNASPDDIHLSQAGQKKLGERMALVYRQLVLGEAVNGKGPRLLVTNPITKSGTTITVKFDSTIVTYLAGETGWSYTGNTAANSNFRVYYDGVEKTISAAELKAGDATMIELTVPTVSGVVVVTYGDRVGPGDGTSYRKGVVYDVDGMPAPMFGPIIAA